MFLMMGLQVPAQERVLRSANGFAKDDAGVRGPQFD